MSRRRLASSALLLAAGICLALPTPAALALSSTTIGGVSFDGDVNDIAVSGDTAYVGGSFSNAGQAAGNVASVTAATSALSETMPAANPAEARALATHRRHRVL